MRTFKEDYKNGTDSENIVKPILEKFFDENYEKTSRFHLLDFQGKGSWIEIKTRTFNKDKFETTLIPQKKIEYAEKCINPVYFVFVFTDGIYYIRYDKSVFDTFSVNTFCRAERSDKRDVAQEYCFIPVKLLSPISHS
jgi:hypothetical protein